jgi:hypothetical protein
MAMPGSGGKHNAPTAHRYIKLRKKSKKEKSIKQSTLTKNWPHITIEDMNTQHRRQNKEHNNKQQTSQKNPTTFTTQSNKTTQARSNESTTQRRSINEKVTSTDNHLVKEHESRTGGRNKYMQIRLQPFTSTNIPYGDNIMADNDNNEKVLFHNINGMKDTTNWYQIITTMKELNIEIFGLAEINKSLNRGYNNEWRIRLEKFSPMDGPYTRKAKYS